MNTELKFRAWALNTMLYSGKDFNSLPLDGKALRTNDKGFATNYKIMQGTGLKDKNGQEIYEGDIVRTFAYEKTHTGEIVFHKTRLSWTVKHSSLTNQDLFIYAKPGHEVRIIGNIFENPELLGE